LLIVETARALECDEDEKKFGKKLGKIASVKPLKGKPKK
jgi:hypothetical protein